MKAAAILALCLLAGCSGLNTAWVLQVQMQYATPQDKPAPTPIPEGKAL